MLIWSEKQILPAGAHTFLVETLSGRLCTEKKSM